MGDNYLYELSNLTETTTEPFVKKEVIWISDQNGGSYSGQITFDCSQIANSGKWASWQEAVLTIPFCIVSKNSGDITASANAFMCGLKNGFYQLINSVQIDMNNTNCVQLTNYLNHFINYKLLTTWSESDVEKWGASLGFAKDTPTSFRYQLVGGATKDGNGVSNNRTFGAENGVDQSTAGYKGGQSNYGLYQRCKEILDVSTGGLASATSFGGIQATAVGGPFMTKANAVTCKKNHFTDNAGATTARVYYFHILAQIRLRDIADFMDKLPLIKGSFMKITINYNASSQTITYTHTGTIVTSSTPTITGATNPLLIPSGVASNPNATNWSTADRTQTFACGVVSATDGTNSITNTLLTTCRITLPLYTMNPTFEDSYISMNPTKEVVYKDVYQFYVSNVSAGSSFNQLITNGISQPLSVVVIPYINKSSQNGNLANVPVFQSPFASEGGTTSPLASITDFNIQVSGQNIFNQNYSYDYEAFLHELRSINAINGGNASGVTSGLLSQTDFELGYRYYVADLSRRLPLDDVAKSIQLLGTNNTNKAMDYLVFVEYLRKITIDMRTGAVLPQ